MSSERNRTRKDLRVEGRIDGEYSRLVMKEENFGVFRLYSPTHPAFWVKITTPFATQTTENIIYQLLKRNNQYIPRLDPGAIMKAYARFYLDKWEADPTSLIQHIEEWSDGWDTTEAVHWPIFSSDVALSKEDLVGMDRKFYQMLERGGLEKYRVSFQRLEEGEIVTNTYILHLEDGGVSTNLISNDDWPQFDLLLPNNGYALVIQPN